MSTPRSRPPGSEQPAAYRRLVRFTLGLGLVTSAGGVLCLIGGAGIYGSPVAEAFEVDRLTGFPNYWEFWMLWVVVAGPIALLPCALLEWWLPRAGAAAMAATAVFVAEAGIRAHRMYWGFAEDNVLIVLGCITTPQLLLAAAFLVLAARRARWQVAIVTLIALALIVVGARVRYQEVKAYWNAHCPAAVERE